MYSMVVFQPANRLNGTGFVLSLKTENRSTWLKSVDSNSFPCLIRNQQNDNRNDCGDALEDSDVFRISERPT